MLSEQLAYAAGIIDGEGCIHVNKRKPNTINRQKNMLYIPKLTVRMTHEPTVKFLQTLFGGSVYCQYPPNNKPIWTWDIQGKHVENALIALSPFMITKKEEALTMLTFYKVNSLEHRESIYWKLRELKKTLFTHKPFE